MDTPHASNKTSFSPSDYEIRIEGRLGSQIAAWFEDMILAVNEETHPPQTIIQGTIVDQAALYGLINRARDLGLTLLSVKRLDETENIALQSLTSDAADSIEKHQSAKNS
ncbi:MAG: hypothetical protein KDJ65_23215 [Anaerolineae bacterium]|nr:hypothetical protein [Anaerolineae bacterium]